MSEERKGTPSLLDLVRAADAIREAQRAYMANRGNDAIGRRVAETAAEYDALRAQRPDL